MSAAIIKYLRDLIQLRENPFQTEAGQEVVSVAESFEARLQREGRVLNSFNGDKDVAAGTSYTTARIPVSPGCVLYPLSVTASCDVDAFVTVVYNTGLAEIGTNKNGIIYESAFLKAGNPLVLRPKIALFEGGSASIQFIPRTNGKVYGSIYGVEVTTNV